MKYGAKGGLMGSLAAKLPQRWKNVQRLSKPNNKCNSINRE